MSKLSFILAAVLALAPLVNASAQQAPTPAPTNAPSAVPPPSAAPNAASLDDRIQDAKADVIRLNRDLMVLTRSPPSAAIVFARSPSEAAPQTVEIGADPAPLR